MSENANSEKRSGEINNDDGDKRSAWAGSLLPGLFLILLGLFFLAKNLTGFDLDNWWALFILIPAVNNFTEAISAVRLDGKLSRSARGHFFWSFFFVLLSAAFILNLDFGIIWPAFLILAGFGVLLGAF